ncbi:tyrosine-type recombinase/integrase, partial [Nostoc sp.]|uniref:tyrosine-type recombinase/integrase n=1 Tax=Nostoc sp. TaxID=1180 RepID=UPI002FF706CB
MLNNSKTLTGKTSKGKVSIYVEKGRIKARLPRQYFGGEQPRLALGMDADESNMARAQRLAERMTLDLQDGCFDETLAKYGIIADLKLKSNSVISDNQLPPKPELSLMEVWGMYCDYRRHDLKESTFENVFMGCYVNFIKSAIKATKSEDAIKIRNWLFENRSLINVKKLIGHLSKAHQIAIRQKMINYNPYEKLEDEITVKGAKGKKQNEIETQTDDDVLDTTKAYSWGEAEKILHYIKNNSQISHWYSFTKFKFFTGCRTGEAIAFMWCDVLWNKEQVLIRRTYDNQTKRFYPTKTAKGDRDLIRIFPIPKDGELWNLLKSIPQGEPNEIVFKSKRGNIILDNVFCRAWKGSERNKNKGIITELIKQGDLNKYLSPYNTRHTFITHQIFDLGRDEKIVSAWCGHGELVSQKHYQDIADRATQVNPELPVTQQALQQSELDSLKEQLHKQQELIN